MNNTQELMATVTMNLEEIDYFGKEKSEEIAKKELSKIIADVIYRDMDKLPIEIASKDIPWQRAREYRTRITLISSTYLRDTEKELMNYRQIKSISECMDNSIIQGLESQVWELTKRNEELETTLKEIKQFIKIVKGEEE